jgi:hypothetical protein
MAARGAGLLSPVRRWLRDVRLAGHRSAAPCPRCASSVRAGLLACPLCGEAMPAAAASRLQRWRRQGVLEVTAVSVVALVFLVTFLVVFMHR